MSSILVTGGAGYIGSHTIVELLKEDHDVVCVDDFSNSSYAAIESIQKITGKNITFYNIDACNLRALDEVFKQHHFETVIHFAGSKAVGESVAFPIMYYRNNIDSILSVCESCIKHNVANIIFSSSATVYGVPKFLPLTEVHPTSATNPYGNTKLFIEQILKDLVTAHPRMNVILLRYFNPVGAHESALLGEKPCGVPNNLMPYICQVASRAQRVLSIYGDNYDTVDGTGVRDYIHVVDLAKGHVAALKRLLINPGCVTYNLGTGRGTSVLQLLTAFISENKINVPYKVTSRRQGDVAECWAATDKAQNELGWKADLGLKEMVRSSWLAQCKLK